MSPSLVLETVRKSLEDNRTMLLSIVAVDDLFLTELVGEEILEESIKEDILAGSKRTEINKRLFKWLSENEDPNVYQKFLAKLRLRENGQAHVANLLDGTPGELPLALDKKTKQNIQKVMKQLTQDLDLDSGHLLDLMLSCDAITRTAYEEIKAESSRFDRAKQFLEVLLRGSDRAYEKFKEEILKLQPEIMKLIEQQEGGIVRPHVMLLNKHQKVLERCTDVNVATIAFLVSKKVIDHSMADQLKVNSEGLTAKAQRIYNWLMCKSEDIFNSFLQAMQENEQRHVANLLKESSTGQLPLSALNHERLTAITPNLIRGICLTGVELPNAMRSRQESDDTDFAISKIDYEVIMHKCQTPSEKVSALIDAVLRRTEYSLKTLEDALRTTGQDNMADFLHEGIVFGAHVKTTRTDKETEISSDLNKLRLNPASQELTSDEMREAAEVLNTLNGYDLPIVAVEVANSIMIYTYCRTPDNVKKYVELFQSGELQTLYEKMLNLVLKSLERENFRPLGAVTVLEQQDRQIIQEFAGLDDCMMMEHSVKTKSHCLKHKFPLSVYCYDCDTTNCSLCIKEDHRLHKYSDMHKSAASLRDQLLKDLTSVNIYKSNTQHWKELLQSDQKELDNRIFEAERVIKERCNDLKEKVEKFQQMLLQEQATFKEQLLKIMTEQRRAVEAYSAIFDDYEKHVTWIAKNGSQDDVCESFNGLHARAKALGQLFQPSFNLAPQTPAGPFRLIQLVPAVPETEIQNIEITEDLVADQENFLVEYMNPESGLIELLNEMKVLSKEAMNNLVKASSFGEKNKQLLAIVMNEQKYRELGIALSRSKQIHLVNYLASKGKYDSKFGPNWPVQNNERELLESMREDITHLFGSFGMCDWLLNQNVINLLQKDIIASKPGAESKADALLEMLKRGSIIDFSITMDLVQHRPNTIEEHRKFLLDSLELDFGLLDKLALSNKDKRMIRNERNLEKRISKVLDIVSDSYKYDEFITALNRSNQTHIANFLNSNGVYDPKFSGDWPLVSCYDWKTVEANQPLLLEKLNLVDMLDALQFKGIINSEQKERLKGISCKRDRNKEFLTMLAYGTYNNYIKTLEHFRASNQIDVAVLLGLRFAQRSVTQTVVAQFQVNVKKELADLFASFGAVLTIKLG